MHLFLSLAFACGVGEYIELDKSCAATCASGRFKVIIGYPTCVSEVDCVYFIENSTGSNMVQCYDICPSHAQFAEPNGSCKNICAQLAYETQGQVQRCVESCQQKYIVDASGSGQKRCVTNCISEFPLGFGAECRKTCPSAAPYTNSLSQCVHDCPESSYQLTGQQKKCIAESDCKYYIQETITGGLKECIIECNSTYSFIREKRCMQTCPFYIPASKSLKTCVDSCSGDALPYHIPGPAAQCLSVCPQRLPYVNSEDNSCLDKCPSRLVTGLDSITCVQESVCSPLVNAGVIDSKCTCLGGFFLQTDLKTCQTACKVGELVSLAGNACTQQCGESQTPKDGQCRCVDGMKHDVQKQKCLAACPSGMYVSEDGIECIAKCPYASQDQQCVSKCGLMKKVYAGECTSNLVMKIAVFGGSALLVTVGVVIVLVVVCVRRKTSKRLAKQQLQQAAPGLQAPQDEPRNPLSGLQSEAIQALRRNQSYLITGLPQPSDYTTPVLTATPPLPRPGLQKCMSFVQAIPLIEPKPNKVVQKQPPQIPKQQSFPSLQPMRMQRNASLSYLK